MLPARNICTSKRANKQKKLLVHEENACEGDSVTKNSSPSQTVNCFFGKYCKMAERLHFLSRFDKTNHWLEIIKGVILDKAAPRL